MLFIEVRQQSVNWSLIDSWNPLLTVQCAAWDHIPRVHTRHQRWDAGCGEEAAPQALELSEMLCRAGSNATEPGDHSAYVHLVGWLAAPPTTVGACR